ncbi:hypothetical protein Pelo_687 [Pelomyxa schiedti]|nr:hypothetical protein Pelo_687 [Pelomyxa schiedti]
MTAEIDSNLVENRECVLVPVTLISDLRKLQLIYPRELLMYILQSEFRGISIYHGKHISDLPISVLSHIVGFLPSESVSATRAVCLQFWNAVRTVHGCEKITFTAQATDCGIGAWWTLTGGDTIATSCMDFKVLVTVDRKERTVAAYLSIAKRKLYAQAKSADFQITYNVDKDSKKLGPFSVFLCTSELERSARSKSYIGHAFTIGANTPMPSKVVQVTVTLKDEYGHYSGSAHQLHIQPKGIFIFESENNTLSSK